MGMCQALYAVLPALPAKGEAGPQISLGQQAAAKGWRQWRRPQGSCRRPAGSALGRAGATAAAAMAAAGGEVQAGRWGQGQGGEAVVVIAAGFQDCGRRRKRVYEDVDKISSKQMQLFGC